MKKNDRVKVGSVVQIDPAHDDRFGASLVVVTDVRPWGVQGYVRVPAAPRAQSAFYRVEWAHIEYVGESSWMAVAQPASAAAVDPHATSTGNPSTRDTDVAPSGTEG